ncbi:serine/threonine protein kinase Sgk2 [Histoplasma capsulatum H143]|uniref:Serine/threonine protein kinase Sgk2 n=1 Tax=Ajellomyces capsulatus (strain H143) TaxID=544712 RepID=C6HT00_AJECH|nr:serine/threonine protein kinase Sgk2 [Histoplasma capsulatum H143]
MPNIYSDTSVLDPNSDGKWAEFPDPPVQDEVLDWWFRLQDDLLSEARGVYFTTMTKKDLIGSDAERQVDLLLKAKGEGGSRNNHNWKDVRVVGELKQSEQEIRSKNTVLQISRYVRDIFTAQPTRRFVHAFAVCGTKMETWVFDRSGPYSSGVLDVYKDPERFFQVILGYAMMSDEELGLNTFTTQNGDGARTITVERAESGEETVLRLDPAPLCSQPAIVCRGMSCFLAKDGDKMEAVAKFSWTSDKRRPEVDLLKLARQRGVKGVARVIGHSAITSVTDMRDGLTFDNRYTFRSAAPSTTSSFTQSHSHNPLSQSFTQLRGLELLTALRDSIKAHRSLYLDRKILYRDISENNIIITNPEKAEGSSGMLIDLDLGKEIGTRSGARHQTGTIEFMAIEVLLNVDHTYQHDLESFFYVLIWQCGRHGWRFSGNPRDQPKDSLLTKWYTGTFRDITQIKQSDMGASEFEDILKEFPLQFDSIKPLCRELQRLFFSIYDGDIFTGTPVGPKKMYGPIIQAFDKAIHDIKAAEA